MKAPVLMKSIRVVGDFLVEGTYKNGDVRILDVRDLPLEGQYTKIKTDLAFFQTVSIQDGYPTWGSGSSELSVDTDLFYDLSKPAATYDVGASFLTRVVRGAFPKKIKLPS